MVLAALFSFSATAATIPMGALLWDVTAPGSTGQFDIFNATGPNALPPDFPVTTSVSFSDLALTVNFSDGSTQTFGSSYFTLNPFDLLSFDGSVIPIGGASPQPVDATLTGSFSTTSLTLDGGGTATILSTFSANFGGGSTPLDDGSAAIIYATEGSTVSAPEPDVWATLAVISLSLIVFLRKNWLGTLRRLMPSMPSATTVVLILACGLFGANAFGAVKLGVSTTPSSGVAGVNSVSVLGSPFPAVGSPSNITVNFASTCGGAIAGSSTANSVVTVLGSTKRVNFVIPGTLATGTYYVSLSDSTDGFVSSNCSAVAVTHTSTTLSACLPTSSLGIYSPVSPSSPVTAIVPNGAWSSGSLGIQVVQLETGGAPPVSPVSLPTTSAVNSCAANAATNEAVCVSNNTDVWTMTATSGAGLTKFTSGATAYTGFSGGSCQNCGVAINALTNQAVIAMGLAGSPSLSGIQLMDLNTNTFGTPLPLSNEVSEDISIDPTRGLVLSPSEASVYTLVQFNASTGGFTGQFNHPISIGGEPDSAAEDCTTGIALTVGEFSNAVYLADLTQAAFTPGSPGTWTAPESVTSIIGSYAAGLSGVTVAPGTAHLATVTGEFGGSSFSVVQLPSTSGSGVPHIADYAYVPCIVGFTAGLDPHTVSAYTSPNDGKAYTVFASYPPPDTLAVVDMAAVLARPRQADGHTIVGTSGSCLAAGDGYVRFVSTH